MKTMGTIILLASVLILVSCRKTDDPDPSDVVIEDCQVFSPEYVGDMIPIMKMESPRSTFTGNKDNFINPCKPIEVAPLLFTSSSIRTHQVTFTFEHVYPLKSVLWTHVEEDGVHKVENVSVDISLNGLRYQRLKEDYALQEDETKIDLSVTAKSIRFVFEANENTYGIQHLRFTLDEGFIIKEDLAFTNAFDRTSGWTGADGIFSYNLSFERRTIGSLGKTAFVFSDTIIGEVSPETNRRSFWSIINNSLGYYDPNAPFEDAFDFDYAMESGRPNALFVPDVYLGKRARHLLDGDGLSLSHEKNGLLTNDGDGTMWRSDLLENELLIDLHSPEIIEKIFLWNDNDTPSYGIKSFSLHTSMDMESWFSFGTYELALASGNDLEPYTMEIDLEGVHARYVKITIESGHDDDMVGLGKIMILGEDDRHLFGSITATHEIETPTNHEKTARLWLQDGIVIEDTFYNFPLLVKDAPGIFQVHGVAMMRMPIENERFVHEETTYLNTPLQVSTRDGGIIYFGAGILDNRDIDGYLYIYGYKDLDGRHLVVGRFLPADIRNFNRWRFYDGQNWSEHIEEASPLKEGVSPELSVTYINEGRHAGTYMLVVMEDSVSGKVSYTTGDTPFGPFGDFINIYQTSEHADLKDAFTYNAKMHPNLSSEGDYLISYNVNSFSFSALGDARIYRPRFIRMIAVKEKE
jgi:hypothetical protein